MRVSRTPELQHDSPYLLGQSLQFGRAQDLDVTVVMPCLNEEASVGASVREALAGMRSAGLTGEVIVVDNGSSDGSASEARLAGARLVEEPLRGYGHACLRGLARARGRIVVLGDADGTYDFSGIPRLVDAMGIGVDVVIGNRLNSAMEPGAMPLLHRHVGNPVLTRLLNHFFGSEVSDAHCGLRAIRRGALLRLELGAPGMEFASEFVIEAAVRELNIVEVPIIYRHRLGGEPKLRTWRDGWRHLQLIIARAYDRRRGSRRKPATTVLLEVGGPPGAA